MDISMMWNKLSNLKKSINPSLGLEKGISIVIPVYKGIDYLDECLKSLDRQVTTTAKFEVIIVLNGDFLREYYHLSEASYENLEIMVLITDKASTGNDSNNGMKSP